MTVSPTTRQQLASATLIADPDAIAISAISRLAMMLRQLVPTIGLETLGI